MDSVSDPGAVDSVPDSEGVDSTPSENLNQISIAQKKPLIWHFVLACVCVYCQNLLVHPSHTPGLLANYNVYNNFLVYIVFPSIQARLQEMATNLEKLEQLRNKSVQTIENYERQLEDLERQESETLREVRYTTCRALCTIIALFTNTISMGCELCPYSSYNPIGWG